ncbi:glutamate receptor 4-like isoform X2 [Eriocheir sinensis]|nr:glutamate receptor 4-like isoform X2 [Eriocheir sinensis]
MVDIMNIIAHHLKFCYRVAAPKGLDWGRRLDNNTFTGMLGEFQRREWDMTLSPVGVSYTRYLVMDFSTPLYMDETSVVYARPFPKADVIGFIKPYTPLMWALLLLSAVLVSGVTLFLQLTHHAQDERAGNDEGRRPAEQGSVGVTLYRSIQWVLCCLVTQSAAWEPRKVPVRLIGVFWLLASLIVGSVYRSNLKAMLILPRTVLPFNSISELAKTDIPVFVIKGSLLDHAMKAAPPQSPLGRVSDQALSSSDLVYMTNAVIQGKMAAFGSRGGLSQSVVSISSRMGFCSLYIATEGILFTSISLGFPKGSPLIPKVDSVIGRLHQSGLLQLLYNNVLGKASHCLDTISTTASTKDVKLRPLELQDFYGIFALYGGGMCLALLTFLVEVTVFRVSHKREE